MGTPGIGVRTKVPPDSTPPSNSCKVIGKLIAAPASTSWVTVTSAGTSAVSGAVVKNCAASCDGCAMVKTLPVEVPRYQ